MADHKFVLPQLHTDAKPNYQPYVKLTFYFKKRPDISYEQFHQHWETVRFADSNEETSNSFICLWDGSEGRRLGG